MKTGNALLRHMPTPTAAHLEALTEYLEKFYKTIVLSDEEASQRKSVVDELEKDIQQFSLTLKGKLGNNLLSISRIFVS